MKIGIEVDIAYRLYYNTFIGTNHPLQHCLPLNRSTRLFHRMTHYVEKMIGSDDPWVNDRTKDNGPMISVYITDKRAKYHDISDKEFTRKFMLKKLDDIVDSGQYCRCRQLVATAFVPSSETAVDHTRCNGIHNWVPLKFHPLFHGIIISYYSHLIM